MTLARRGIAASIARIFSGESPEPPASAPRKRLVLEPLESRVLLSADPLSAGSLLVIDGAVEDQAHLLEQFSGSDVLILDHERDGLQQISEALASRSDISELHIISHGARGSLALGSTTLDAASLESHEAQLRTWADALTADADILFYGCNVAADEGFVHELSCLTGADIAASTDFTGNAALGGDWVLEYASGSIEADVVTASMDGVLAIVNYNAATQTLTFTADAGQADVVTVSNGLTANVLRIVANDAIVLTGDTAGFTLNGAGTQLDINRTVAPIAPFNVFLGDLNDSFTVNPTSFNGVINLAVQGEDGVDTVTLPAMTPSAITISAETINLGGSIDSPGSQTYSGAVNITAGVTMSTGAAGTITFDGSIAAGANALTLSAAEINLPTAANSVSGTNTITLQPATDAGAIVIGGAADSSATALDLTDSDIAALAGGFSSITIGRSSGNGAITVDASGASFGDNLTVRAPTAGGTITVNGVLATTADPGIAALTLDATTITLNSDAVTAGGAITIADPVLLGTPATVTLDTTDGGSVAGANITLSSVNDTAGSSTLVLAGTLAISSGTVTLNTATQAANLSLTAGVLTGAGTLTVTGLTTWSAGTMSGTGVTNTDGGLTLNAGGQKRLEAGRTLNTAGTTTWSGSTGDNTNEIIVLGGSTINNSGTWNDQNTHLVRLLGSTGGGTFNNNGTYTRNGATGETQVSVAFNNAGAVNVNAGALALGGGGTHTGSFSGAGRLEFSGGTHTLSASSSIAVANATVSQDNTVGTVNFNGSYNVTGTTQVTGNTANFNGTVLDLGTALSVSGGTANLGAVNDALSTLSVSAGTLSSNGTLTVSGAATISGGTITGAGTLSIAGLTTWSAGTMSGTGVTNTDGGLAINTAGQKRLEGGRDLNTASTTTWSGSTGPNTNEIIVLGGSTINNNGTWNDQNTHLVRLQGSTGGGTFNNNGNYIRSGAAGETQISIAFNNSGAVDVNGGTLALGGGGTDIGSFSGAGRLEFSGGTHTLSASSSIAVANATFSADDTAGTVNINGSYNVTGTTQVTGNTANFNGTVLDLGTALSVSGGTANLGAVSDALSTLSVSAGTLLSAGTLTVSGAATITGGTITGAGTLSVAGLTTWSAGTMSGTGVTNTDGGLTLNTAGQKRLDGGRDLNTAGTTTWSGSTGPNTNEIIVLGGSTINNSGIWNDQNTHLVRLQGSTGGGTFNNSATGTYTRSGATGETQISVAFNNAGVVNVTAGTLTLGGGGNDTGSFSGAGRLEFSGGTHTLSASSSIAMANATFSADDTVGTVTINGSYNVTGTTQVTGNTANFNGTVLDLGTALSVSGGTANLGAVNDALSTLSVSAGTLSSNGTLTVSGAATISGGTITGAGTLSIAGLTTWSAGTMSGTGVTNTDGGLTINTSTQKTLSGGRTLNTAGTTTWSGSIGNFTGELLVLGGSTINNNGTWNDLHNFLVRMNASSGGGSFDNLGTYTKSGTGETQIGVVFNNTTSGPGTGVVSVNGGTLALSGGGTHTGSFSTGAGTTLEFGGGTHNLNNASAVTSLGRLLVSADTVNTSGTLTTGGLLELTGGTLGVGGVVDATTYLQSGGTLSGAWALNVSGQSTWSAGTMTGTGQTNTNGGLNISGIGNKNLLGGRVLNTAGTTNWSGNTASFNNEIFLSGGSSINNTGTWNDQNAFLTGIINASGVNEFNNTGTYTKTGAAETQITVLFDSAGTVNANGGTLSLDGGGVSGGSFTGAGGVLEFGGGTHQLQAASSVTSVGTVRFDGGTVNVAGSYDVTGTTAVAGSTANFTGTLGAVGALQISSGTANFSSGELVAASTLDLGGTLTGTDTVNVSGQSTWTGGTMSGTGQTNTNGGLNISGNGNKSLAGGRVLNTSGTTNWSGNTAVFNNEVFLSGGSSINNAGTWNDQNAFLTGIFSTGGVNELNNTGTYTKTGAAETQINVVFDNAGAVNANGGTLSLDGGGVSSGAFATAGGVLEFGGGVHQLGATSSVTSAGTVRFDGGTVNVAGSYNVTGTTAVAGSTANFTGTVLAVGALQISSGTGNFSSAELIQASTLDLSGGTLAGTDTVDVAGQSTWTGGTMSGTGQTNTDGGLNISGNGNKVLSGGRALNTAGATNWSGNTATFNNEIFLSGGASINNAGTWNDQNAFLTAIANSGGVNQFNNTGTYSKSGAAETQIGVGVDNSGSVRVQTGLLNVSGALVQTGTIDVASGATLRKLGGFTNAEGAFISGRGTIDAGTGTLTNSGTIRPGGLNAAGLLSITGNLVLTDSSVIDFELAGTTRGSQYDALDVSGAVGSGKATLDGDANIIHLGFVPGSADVFRAIDASGGIVAPTRFDSVNPPASFEYETLYQANFVTFQLSANDPPVAVNDSYSTAEDTALTIAGPGVLANDTDPEANPLTAVLGTGPSHGVVTFNADGGFTYAPNANFSGSDSFTYRASDGLLQSDLAIVTLTVTPVNDPPVANNDSVTTNEDTALTFNARVNDTDIDSVAVTVSQFTQGAHGSVSLNTSGAFIYTPDLNFFGSDTFTYRVRDTALAESNEATVTVTVLAVNDAPDAVDDSYAIDEDTALTGALANVLANDSDVDNTTLTAQLVTNVSHGTLALNANGSFTYTPDADFFGIDTFEYRASDGLLSDIATATITVGPVNDAPDARDDAYAVDEDNALSANVLANDTDIDSTLTATLLTDVSHGTLTLNSDGSFTYMPHANYFGPDSFTYRASDGSLTDTATATISVNPVNDAPVAADDSYTTDEDTQLTIAAPGVLANDSDVELEALTAALVSGPAHGVLALAPDGSFTYAPDANYFGADSFTYRTRDTALAESNTATVAITVNAVNDAPIAQDDAYAVDEDHVLTVAMPGVLANDADIDSADLEALLETGPAHGSLTLDANGSVTYTPDANFNGTDSFSYRVSDDDRSDIGEVTITVNAVNDVPLAADDSYATDEDTPLAIAVPGVLANDSDVDLDALNAALESGPAHGTLAFNTDGSFVYTPDVNFFGDDSFSYRVSDGTLSDTGLVSIRVNPVNDAPVARDDTYETDEDVQLVVAIPGVLGNDTDVDSAALQAALLSGPAHGSLAINADGSFTYTPDANFNGSDSFTYRVSDGNLADSGVVTLTVNAVNDAPVAQDDAYAVAEDGVLTVAAPGVLANDTDVDLEALAAALLSGPSHGSLTFNADGSFTYTPEANFNGSDSFAYRVSDDELFDAAVVSIAVNAVNDAPNAEDDFYTTDEDVALSGDVLANDTDVDSVSVTATLLTGVSHGTLVFNGSGTFSYTPDADFFGIDTFVYRASDGLLSDDATATITVLPVNGAPVAHDDAYAVNEDGVLSITAPGVLANDVDSDSPVLTAALLAGPAHGSLVFNNDGGFTYTPQADFFGSDAFTYSASDGTFSDTAVVTITVNAVNDAPVARDDLFAVDEDGVLTVAAPGVLGNDSDVDSALQAALVSGPAHGVLSFNADGSFGYTPHADYFGADSFTYSASDGSLSDVSLVSIVVNPVNDAPVARVDAYAVDEDGVLTVSAPGVLANDTDIDSAALEASLVTGPAHGVLTFNPDGSFTYAPQADYFGSDTFTYRVSDDDLSDAALVIIAVNAVGDAPVARDDLFSVDEDGVLTVAAPGVLGNDSDVDSPFLHAALVSGPTHGVLTLNGDGSFSYTPHADYFGGDSFTYSVSDGVLSDTGLVSIVVSSLNDAPVARDDAYAVDEDGVLTVAAPGVLGNDIDIDSAALAASLLTGPAHGVLALSADGSFSYTPHADFNGTDTFSYQVSDGDRSDAGQVLITVRPVNDRPVAGDDAYATDEDTTLIVAMPGVLGNDSDVDLDALNVTLESGPAHGSLTLDADGSFSYTPHADYFGGDSFTYRVSDGLLDDTATVSITVNALNDAPVAFTDVATTDEDTAVTVNVRGNDEDVDGDALAVVDATDGLNGTVVVNANGTLTYTPNANFHGTDVFSYVVSDGEETDDALVFVTVAPVNDDPDALDDTATTAEGVAVTIPVLTNDQDVDGDALTVAAVTQGAHGTVAINPDGTLTYSPNAGFDGGDSYTYTVNDGHGGSDTATVAVTVNAAGGGNGAPVFTEVADRAVMEGTEVRFTVSAADPDGDTLVYMAADLPAGATFDAVTREFRWIPADDASATVTFTVLDSHGAGDTMEVALTASNAAPTVDAGADQVVGLQKDNDDGDDDDGLPGGGRKVATIDLHAAFNDLGTADTHSAVINWGDGASDAGVVSESPFGPPGSTAGANGTVAGSHTYTKAGVYTVMVTVTDDNGGVRADTMVVRVQKPDNHLKGKTDKYEVVEDHVLQVSAGNGVLSNDQGSGALAARLVDGPEHGALTLNANGSFTYVPDADYHGKDVFWYEFNDGLNVSKLVKVELKVKDDGLGKIDWSNAGWGALSGFCGGGKPQHNLAEFLIKLAAKRG